MIRLAILSRVEECASEVLSAHCGVADWMEVRADLAGDPDIEHLRRHFSGKLLYTLRDAARGGAYRGSRLERISRLRRWSNHYDAIEVDTDVECLFADIPPAKRVFATHISPAGRPADLVSREALFNRFILDCDTLQDEVQALLLLSAPRSANSFAMLRGRTGYWSQVLACKRGASVLAGSLLDGHEPLMPSLRQLLCEVTPGQIRDARRVYGIAGFPIQHSISPAVHNEAYRALGHAGLYLPFNVESFDDFWKVVVEGGVFAQMDFPIDGLTVVSPHKEAALRYAGQCTAEVQACCSTNALIRRGGDWMAATTDWSGVQDCLRALGIDVANHAAAVIGCGGAGRVIAKGLKEAGAGVTILNRGKERGEFASRLLGSPFAPLASFDPSPFSIIVNATPLGRNGESPPFRLDEIGKSAAVVDLCYNACSTPLISWARDRGHPAIDGREIASAQIVRQLRLMTGRDGWA